MKSNEWYKVGLLIFAFIIVSCAVNAPPAYPPSDSVIVADSMPAIDGNMAYISISPPAYASDSGYVEVIKLAVYNWEIDNPNLRIVDFEFTERDLIVYGIWLYTCPVDSCPR